MMPLARSLYIQQSSKTRLNDSNSTSKFNVKEQQTVSLGIIAFPQSLSLNVRESITFTSNSKVNSSTLFATSRWTSSSRSKTLSLSARTSLAPVETLPWHRLPDTLLAQTRPILGTLLYRHTTHTSSHILHIQLVRAVSPFTPFTCP